MLASFVALVAKVTPNFSQVFNGYVPSHAMVENGGLYVAISIIGATVMPHAFVSGKIGAET